MAVAHVVSSASHASGSFSVSQASFSWTHTTSTDPQGVLVLVFQGVASTDAVTSVTYDGVTVPAVSGGRATDTATEPGSCAAYFLGSGVPATNNPTVVVNRTNNTTTMWAVCATVTAASDTEAVGVVLAQENGVIAQQSVADGSTGADSVRYAGVYYGGATPAPAGADSTLLHSDDAGAYGWTAVRETTAGQGSRLVGCVQATSDDRAGVHLAIREVVGTATPSTVTAVASIPAPSISTGGGMGFRSSTSIAPGSGTSAAPAVPTGAAVGDVAVVGLYMESAAAVTPPAGFTQKADLQTSATARGRLVVFWKRLTAADTGTYTFTWTGATWRGAVCGLWSGRIATGDPFDGTVGTAESTTSVSTLNVSTSPSASNGDAVGMWTNFNGGATWTAPASYTERQDTNVITLDSRDAVASGSTGNVTATSTVSDFMKAFLGVLAVANGDVTATPSVVAATTTIPTPSVTGTANATVTPGVVAAVAAIPGPTVIIAKYVTATAGTGSQSYFADAAGDPILVRGYVLWGLLMNAGRWGGTWQADLENAVAGLQAMGVNVLYTEPLGNTQNGGAFNNGNTWDGVAPFTSTSPVTFNTTFWSRSDYLFDLCEAAGITVFFNWAYSDDLDTAALAGFNSTQFGQYGTALGNRYKTRPNLVWMMGGDYFDTFASQVATVKSSIRATGDTHLFGVQNYPETTSRKDIENNSTQTTGTNSSEFNFVYSYNAIYWGIEYAWTESSPLPVMWGDGHFDADTTADRKVMRDLTWWTFSSGGRGMIYGSEGTWAWGSGALANLTSDTFPNTDMDGIQNLFASFPNWHQLVPDTDSSFVTAGRGTKSDYVTSSGGGGGEYNSSDTQAPYVTASITADGTLAVVYFPVDQTVTVNDAELNAGYTATWVDPISGATSSATIASTYSPTGNNSLGGPDWLLVFEAPAETAATPSTVTGTAAVPAPSVHAGSTAAPAAVVGATAVPSVTVRLSVAIAATAVTAAASVPTATVAAGATVTTSAVAATATVPAPTMHTGATATPTVVSGATVVPTPTVQTSGNVTATPSTVNATATIPVPSLASNSSVSAITVQGAASVPAPSVSAGTAADPTTVAGVSTVPAPAVSTGGTATPAAVAGAATVPAPAVSAGGSATVAPATVNASAGVPAPTLSTGSKVTASTVAAVAAIPAPAVVAGSSATATPAVVAGTTTITVPTIRLSPNPVTVNATATVPTPSVHTSVLVPAFSVAAVATIPAPSVVSVVPGTAHSATGAAPAATVGVMTVPTATGG